MCDSKMQLKLDIALLLKKKGIDVDIDNIDIDYIEEDKYLDCSYLSINIYEPEGVNENEFFEGENN